MPVVINEFEVVPDTRPAARSAGADDAASDAAPPPLDPCAVAQAERVLRARALRVWAH